MSGGLGAEGLGTQRGREGPLGGDEMPHILRAVRFLTLSLVGEAAKHTLKVGGFY